MTYQSLKRLLSTLVAGALLSATHAGAYPLDGYQETDIARLDAYWLARNVIIEQKILPKGIFWPSEDIKMRLFDNSKYTLPAPDAALSAKIRKMLGPDANGYGIALLDYTTPASDLCRGESQQGAEPGKRRKDCGHARMVSGASGRLPRRY